jgi:hypothetical protein
MDSMEPVKLKRKIRVNYLLSLFAGLIATAIIAYFAWIFISPFNPADVKVPITVQNHEVVEGTPVYLILESCTFKEVPVKVEVQLVGASGTNEFVLPLLTVSGTSTKKGCTAGQPSPIPLNKSQFPLAITSGKYKIRLHTTYTVNWARTLVEDYDSETFNYVTTTPVIPKQ